MEPQIRPEPTAEERGAILAALERLFSDGSGPPAYRSAWREAGIRENLDEPDEEVQEALPEPRWPDGTD